MGKDTPGRGTAAYYASGLQLMVQCGDEGSVWPHFQLFQKMQEVRIFMWNLPNLKCWHKKCSEMQREPSSPHLCAEFSPRAWRAPPLDQMMSDVFSTSERFWPGSRLSLQSVCFWLSVLFLLQFKQSGRRLKCNCVYKTPWRIPYGMPNVKLA